MAGGDPGRTAAVGAAPATAPLGVYVHVPFCPARCAYCDFTAYVYRPDLAAGFAADVLREAELLAAQPGVRGRRAGTLYFGGGTPTVLPAEELAELAAGLRRLFGLGVAGGAEGAAGPEPEVTVEANPETVDARGLGRLRAAGFNRLSLGLQAWDDRLLSLMGRRHTAADFLRAYRAARRAGFANVSVDVMYGLPGQTLAGWRETLERVVALGPEHVSAYSLQVEEGTALARWLREGRLAAAGGGGGRRRGTAGFALPGEEEVAAMYALARAFLAASGYEQYELSNFARPGYRSRHNQVYWRNGDYLGLGPGASSHLGGRRWTNERRLDRYRAALAAGRLPVAEAEALGREREMSDTVILGLRLLEGVPLADFRRRFGVDLLDAYGPAVRELRRLGLVEVEGGRLRLTAAALPVANQAFVRFL